MKIRVAAFAITAMCAFGQNDNPLLRESTLPYNMPAFDRLRNEHFQPAIEQGIAEREKEVEAIAGNPDRSTFENTIVAMERSGQLLSRANRIFSNLNATNTNPAMQRIQRELSPKLAAHSDRILLNARLFARIETLYKDREKLGLDPESNYLLERYYKEFVRAGARLSDADKTRLKAINRELAELQTRFAQNVLKDRNASSVLVASRAELDGLSPNEIAAAAAAAREEEQDGKYAIRLLNTTTQPALASLKNRALRRRILDASLARNIRGGEFDNREVVSRIARLRATRAALLGYANHAAYILEDETAGTIANVNRMLAAITPKAVGNARKEAAALQAVVDREQGGFPVAAWDWDFYSEKVRQARYAFDQSQLRPYFELNHVLIDGVFYAATREYGITFKERHDLPVYLDDVRVFEVFDADGKPLALFLADWYARPSKNGGAWSSAYVSQSKLLGMKPVVANHLNIPKPPAGEPALLTWDEVRTAFHEFGHALHTMFSDIRYPRLSGVPRDFAEFPSQVNEMWAGWPEVLKHYARHYKTGEPMPAELLGKLEAADKFNQGYKTTEYLAATLLDQAWHQLKPEEVPTDALVFESQALAKAGVALDVVPPRYRTAYFSHIFSGGYSAGYYAYIWAEVLDADTVEWFREHGGLSKANGDRYRAMVLSRRGTDDALKLFKAFTGRDPYIEPLLKRRGLD
jgi:peptidyl-dipeptidase Dcp